MYTQSIKLQHHSQKLILKWKKFQGLISKTWLSETIGGFYEFDSQINAQTYIDELLIPFTKQIGGQSHR